MPSCPATKSPMDAPGSYSLSNGGGERPIGPTPADSGRPRTVGPVVRPSPLPAAAVSNDVELVVPTMTGPWRRSASRHLCLTERLFASGTLLLHRLSGYRCFEVPVNGARAPEQHGRHGQSTKSMLVLNLGTARALGLSAPYRLRLRGDDVMERTTASQGRVLTLPTPMHSRYCRA